MDQAAVIEVLDRDGQVRSVHKVQGWPLRIGRSPACELVLDDAHLAGEHAELSWGEEGPQLRLLPSLNGGWLGTRRLAAGEPQALPDETVWQLGNTRLRLRTLRSTLAPEKPLAHPDFARSPLRHLLVPGLALLWAVLLWLDQWLGSDPGAPWVQYAPAMLAPFALVLVWSAVWALVSMLFHRWFAFLPHLRRVLIVLVTLHLLGMGLPVLAYALSWPRLLVVDALVFPVGLVGLLWWHASFVWPRARRLLAAGLGSLLVVSLALMVGKRWEQQYWFGPAYLSVLPPPVMRLASPKPVEALVDSLAPLEAQLKRQAAKDNEVPSQDGMEE
ncbi:FHA domain-containing protein [Pelomonas sp. APW6]|uniref:FHA domain-containing protein n=1 Tax=Roseateles subflavus TaxID=3053353 RepID=A0ABT7LG13_9BURK|nr:FHA domain-containing protein [Pelomonas sp. APW6]MDL5031790.1 FHA domain-containing protein [Pelomonas sp. APW6]